MSRRNEFRLYDALPNAVSGFIERAALLAGIVLGATLLYFAYALLTGVASNYPSLAYVQRVKVIHNLHIASVLFTASAVVVLVYGVLYMWEQRDLAASLAVIGALLYFGTPFALSQVVGPFFFNAAVNTIQSALTNVGVVVLAAAVGRAIPLLIQQITGGVKGYGEESVIRRTAAKQRARMVHPLSPCWALPYCNSFFREHCIRYRERKTCWRTKNGCLCNDEIMRDLLLRSGGTPGTSKERATLDFLPGGGSRTTLGKRLKCTNCFIYLEHQRLKHRWAAPLAVLGLVIAGWLVLPTLESAYLQFGRWATHIVASVALTEVDTGSLMGTFTNPVVKWLIFFCLGVYALTSIQHFLEYLFFKLKV